jgi:hypothetical protein
LGSAYILGGTAEHLNEIYEKEVESLEPWHDAPAEITTDDWKDFLGKREWVVKAKQQTVAECFAGTNALLSISSKINSYPGDTMFSQFLRSTC